MNLPCDVRLVGVAHQLVEFADPQDGVQHVLHDEDLAHPGIVGGRGELDAAVFKEVSPLRIGQQRNRVSAKGIDQRRIWDGVDRAELHPIRGIDQRFDRRKDARAMARAGRLEHGGHDAFGADAQHQRLGDPARQRQLGGDAEHLKADPRGP